MRSASLHSLCCETVLEAAKDFRVVAFKNRNLMCVYAGNSCRPRFAAAGYQYMHATRYVRTYQLFAYLCAQGYSAREYSAQVYTAQCSGIECSGI